MTRVRIAPSPTGDPHVGTAYIGLINYLFAKQRGGKFVLRIEDTDQTRFVSTSENMIFDSLRWLGLNWDEGPDVGGEFGPYRQSERTHIYREYILKLLISGHAYWAYETPEELELVRQQQIAAKQPPRYNGAHRNLTADQIEAYEAEDRPRVVRLRVPENEIITFRDELRGDIPFESSSVDDQVLLKSDGFPTYHLANVVDDHLMKITDVIRAEEWISSTPKHVLLYKAFGWEPPKFWHMPLLRNADKSKISKRKNPVSLNFYRDSGYLPAAVINFLGLMGGGMHRATEEGTKSNESDIFSLDDMVDRFDLTRMGRGAPVFDTTKLKWLNGEYLRKLSPSQFYAELRNTVLSEDYLSGIAALVQERVETLGQFGEMTHFFFVDSVVPDSSILVPKGRTLEEVLEMAGEQLQVLEASSWNADAIRESLIALGTSKEWKMKDNFGLLRAVITGSKVSPPLVESLVLFGKARTLDRMRRFIHKRA